MDNKFCNVKESTPVASLTGFQKLQQESNTRILIILIIQVSCALNLRTTAHD